MESSIHIDHNIDTGKADLGESWVQLQTSEASEEDTESVTVIKGPDDNDALQSDVASADEKALLKAIRAGKSTGGSSLTSSSESCQTVSGVPSGKASPDARSPQWEDEPMKELVNSGRVWDWASRPEVIPPPGFPGKMRHPGGGVRRGDLYRYYEPPSIFCWENLPKLLVSHVTAFLFGAAAAFAFSRLRSAASYGSVVGAASDAAIFGASMGPADFVELPLGPPSPIPTLPIIPVVNEPSSRAGGFLMFDRIF